MIPRTRALALVAAIALSIGVAGCSSTVGKPEKSATPAVEKSVEQGKEKTALPTDEQQKVLGKFDLDGKNVKDIIADLEQRSLDNRPSDTLFASVRPNELQVKTGDEEFSLNIEEGFYLSFAPYVESTHECYFHSLTTCMGELGGEDVQVKITDDKGEVLVEETATLNPNGFVGYWLPRDIKGTLEVTYDDVSGSVPFATSPEDPTCVTTLQMTK